jgi:hypothetical protein
MATKNAVLQGQSLRLSVHAARRVRIRPCPSLVREVRVTAAAADVREIDDLDIAQGAEVCILQKDSGFGSGNIVAAGGSVSNRIVVNGVDVTDAVARGGGRPAGPTLELDIEVPEGFALDVTARRNTSVLVGDIGGPLIATADSNAKISAGRVAEANLTATSNGEVQVSEVAGQATLDASSSGEIHVAKGTVAALVASASSSGEIDFRGEAKSGSASASSSGEVRIAVAGHKFATRESSSGEVVIGLVAGGSGGDECKPAC